MKQVPFTKGLFAIVPCAGLLYIHLNLFELFYNEFDMFLYHSIARVMLYKMSFGCNSIS